MSTPWEKDPAFVWPLLEQPERPRSTYEGDIANERMPAPKGFRGPKVREVVRWARSWWNRQGRHMVRGELPLNPEQGGVPSRILRGLQFGHMDRDEALQIVRMYYRHIVVPQKIFEKDYTGEIFILDPLAHAGKVITTPREPPP